MSGKGSCNRASIVNLHHHCENIVVDAQDNAVKSVTVRKDEGVIKLDELSNGRKSKLNQLVNLQIGNIQFLFQNP